MKDPTTITGDTVPATAIDQLLATADCDFGARSLANTTLTEEAAYAYELAHGLSGGGDLHADAHQAGISNLLGKTVPAAVAFALHHLGALLPDLTAPQWERIDAACAALHPRIARDLSGANGTDTATLSATPRTSPH
ncbi:hypothetical protein [Streptomyces sp. XH2]|uniref:hypothetical protein n=1 Tax=Streptomyces sp. XH2 TaxID=3412483 RepID=UPI003C79AA87